MGAGGGFISSWRASGAAKWMLEAAWAEGMGAKGTRRWVRLVFSTKGHEGTPRGGLSHEWHEWARMGSAVRGSEGAQRAQAVGFAGVGEGWSKKRIKKRSRVGPGYVRGRSAGAGVIGVGIGIFKLIVSPLS